MTSSQVAVLNVLYFATFGSELAVVSMLPLFFADVFELDMVIRRLAGVGICLYEPDVATGWRLAQRSLPAARKPC